MSIQPYILIRNIFTRGRCSTIPTLTLYSLDRIRGMVDVYNYIIRVVNILTFIYLDIIIIIRFSGFVIVQ